MFRQCRGFSHDDDSSTGSDYGLERATPEGEEEEEALLIPSSLKESSTESFVLEVVGALGLNVLGEDVDTFCLISNVSASGVSTILHRTDTIDNDTAPIWTLKTKSTCIVKVEKVDPREQLRIELCQRTLGIPGVSDMQIIGGMYLNYSTLLANGDATRREYPIAKEEHPGILLALRFRKASAVDSTTLKQLNEYESDTLLGQSITILSEQLMMKTTGEDHAGDIDFEHVTAKPLLGNSTTVIEGGIPQKAYRVWPFPDADNPKETTFMTKTQIKETALQPSRYWVKASDGAADDYGSIFLEVLGCSNLPNMVSVRMCDECEVQRRRGQVPLATNALNLFSNLRISSCWKVIRIRSWHVSMKIILFGHRLFMIHLILDGCRGHIEPLNFRSNIHPPFCFWVSLIMMIIRHNPMIPSVVSSSSHLISKRIRCILWIIHCTMKMR